MFLHNFNVVFMKFFCVFFMETKLNFFWPKDF